MVTHNSKSDLPLAILLEHMHKKFEINRTKLKGGCQSGRKVVTHNPKSDLPLAPHDSGYLKKKNMRSYVLRGKSLLELWVTTFLPD